MLKGLSLNRTRVLSQLQDFESCRHHTYLCICRTYPPTMHFDHAYPISLNNVSSIWTGGGVPSEKQRSIVPMKITSPECNTTAENCTEIRASQRNTFYYEYKLRKKLKYDSFVHIYFLKVFNCMVHMHFIKFRRLAKLVWKSLLSPKPKDQGK